MKWFEPIIIIVAIFLVCLPIILQIRNKKKGKTCCCGTCKYKGKCLNSFKEYYSKNKV